MEPAPKQQAHFQPPGIRQPVDSYHRQLHEDHGVVNRPLSQLTGSSPTPTERSNSQRHTIASAELSQVSSLSNNHVAAQYDTARTRPAEQDDEAAAISPISPEEEQQPKIKWPLLGGGGGSSIRSQPSVSSLSSHHSGPQSCVPDTALPENAALPWRPFFLRRSVLAVFIAAFVVLIVGLEVAAGISARDGSIWRSNDSARILWQYGTCVVFVVVAAWWSRVEYQAAVAMPWIRMLRDSHEPDQSLLLDYLSTLEPWTLVKSIKNKDWLVACTAAIGLLLKIVIIFATAVITPRVGTASDRSAPITLQMSFADGTSGLQDVGTLPYFAMAGLQTSNLSLPNGVSSRAAYLPFTSTNDYDYLNATVDGFAAGLNCEQGKLTLNAVDTAKNGITQLSLAAELNSCKTQQTFSSTRFDTSKNTALPNKFLAFQAGSCGDSTKTDDQRVVVMGGTVDLQKKALSDSIVLLCMPSYAITQINVGKASEMLLSTHVVHSARNTTLSKVQPWNIAQAHFDSYASSKVASSDFFATVLANYDNEAILDADQPMLAALTMQTRETGNPPKLTLLERKDDLQQLAGDYFAQYSALIARYAMMQPASDSATGIGSVVNQRLIVRPAPTHLMTALLIICLILTGALILLTPRHGILPRDPGTLADMAAVVAHSHPLVEILRGLGGADEEAIRSKLSGTKYSAGTESHEKMGTDHPEVFHIYGGRPPRRNIVEMRPVDTKQWQRPIPLNALIRLLYVIALASVIIAFEISYQESHNHNGFTTPDTDGAFLAWTVLPALTLLLLAQYIGLVDWWTRVLAPLAHLSRHGEFADTVGLNLIDASRPAAFAHSVWIGDFGAAFTAFGAFLAALFVVASAALFGPAAVQSMGGLALRADDYFGNSSAFSAADPICTDCNNDTIVASLILTGDAPYPPFTFGDLSLPSFTFDEKEPDDYVKITTHVAAVRPKMSCRMYLSNDIATDLTIVYNPGTDTVSPMNINIATEKCPKGSALSSQVKVLDSSRSNSALMTKSGLRAGSSFGLGVGKTNESEQCSDWLYAWGRLSEPKKGSVVVTSVSAMACNESIESVGVDVVLHGTDLHMDAENGPTVDETEGGETTVAIPDLDYSNLVTVSSDQSFDTFFSLLDASPYAVSAATIADPTDKGASQVAAAIVKQHGIIRAQSLNFKSRRHLASDGTFPVAAGGGTIISGVDPSATESEAVPTVNGSILSNYVRLVQNATATRVLEAIIGAVLLSHVVAWLLRPKMRLPRNPTTIASVVALLVDGNLTKILPRDAQWLSKSDLKQSLVGHDKLRPFLLTWDWPGRPIGTKRKRGRGLFGVRARDRGLRYDVNEPVEMSYVLSNEPPARPEAARTATRRSSARIIPIRRQLSTTPRIDDRPEGRVGIVRTGTGRVGREEILRKSVLLGHEHKDSVTTVRDLPRPEGTSKSSSAPKPEGSDGSEPSEPSEPDQEIVKVWWAPPKTGEPSDDQEEAS